MQARRTIVRIPVRKIALFLAMLVLGVVMFYPYTFMIDASFRTQSQFESGVGRSLDSWNTLFTSIPVGQQLGNSLIVALGALIIIVAVSSAAGFAFAKLTFRGSTVFLLGIVAAMMIPLQSIIIPEYVNLAQLGLLSDRLGAVLVYAAVGIPFATFLMTTYYRGLPDDIIEAAVIDGLSYRGVFFRLGLPLAMPAIVTVIVLQFVQIWGDLLIGLLFLQNTDQRTITVGLGVLSSGRTTDIPVLMAGALVSAVPAVIVYLVFQRFLIRGLTAGIGK
jgi:ABC-type glycerol-3-phosphate transport system permease component